MVVLAAPATPIAAHPMLVFLLQLTVLLGVAFALGKLAARFNMPAVVGELAAGVILGPSLLAHAIPRCRTGCSRPTPRRSTCWTRWGSSGC